MLLGKVQDIFELLLCRSIERTTRMREFLRDDCLKYVYIIQISLANISSFNLILTGRYHVGFILFLWHGCALYSIFAENFPRFIAHSVRMLGSMAIFWFVAGQCHRTRTAHTLYQILGSHTTKYVRENKRSHVYVALCMYRNEMVFVNVIETCILHTQCTSRIDYGTVYFSALLELSMSSNVCEWRWRLNYEAIINIR